MKLQYISEQRQLIKSFYSGIGKTAVIFPSAFFVATGGGLIALGMVFYLREVLGASPSQVGWLAALWSLCYISGCTFIRPLFDRVLPRYSMVTATFCMCIFTLAVHYAGSILWIYVLWGLYGLATSLFWPPMMAWLSQNIEGIALSRAMSKFNFSWSAGMVVSPFLAGWLSEKTPQLPLYSGSTLFLLAGFMIVGAILVLPAIRNDRSTGLAVATKGGGKGKDTPLRYPAWVGLYVTYAVMGVILTIFPMAARDVLSLSKSVIGLLLLTRALLATCGFIILGKTTFWHFKTQPMVLGQLLLVFLLISLVYVHSPLWIGLVLGCMGLLIALSYSYSLFHGVSGSINRAKRMAVHESLLSAGFISGSSIGGILYQQYSIGAVYWFCSALVMMGVITQVGLGLRAKKTETRHSG